MGDKELHDDLFLRYGIETLDLHPHCDVFNARISICQAFDCKKGILFTTHHKELCDGVYELTGKAFTPSHLCENSLMH